MNIKIPAEKCRRRIANPSHWGYTKRSILIIITLLTSFKVQAQLPLLQVWDTADRLPNLYYWDTNWVDYKVMVHNESQYTLEFNGDNTNASRFVGRPCIAETPIKVIGIAAFLYTDYNPMWVLDNSLANRLPEYFRIYQMELDSFYLLRETRWDTTEPQYLVSYSYFMGSSYDSAFKLYEAYFEKPVYVHDTFCIGGTTWNTLVHGRDEEVYPNNTAAWVSYDHVPTYYACIKKYFADSMTYLPTPPFYVMRYLWPTCQAIINEYSGPNPPYDTTVFNKITPMGLNLTTMEQEPIEYWVPFFAILDTDFSYESCLGVTTTGLAVEGMDTSGVTLTWDDSGVEEWQVKVIPSGMDSGMLFSTPINYLQVTGLEQGKWYTAIVRTKCDSILYGEWSMPLSFYIPTHFDTCEMPTGLYASAVDSGSVTLAWNMADVLSWTVEMNPVELGMSNGQIQVVTTNTLQVDGLYTNCWYWARVRALCDTDWYSDWTDTIRFYVPNQHPGGADTNGNDTTTTINLVEQYTYLMPNPARDEVTVISSFRIKSVKLYGSDGKLLKEQEVDAIGTRLSLEGLPAGVYFVRVRTSAGVTTKRLVIQP